DATLLLDAPVEIGLARAASRPQAADRFEREKQLFFEKVRQAYLDMAAQQPQRYHIIDASQPLEQVKIALNHIIHQLIK
ncbi:MAG TPA: dTMP kinase, partial [Candidatus Tenderia electrophaga]|nr:dTMP kinase [Candidatus Tenderia electrophaga]